MPFGRITKSLVRRGRKSRRSKLASKAYVNKKIDRMIEDKVQQSSLVASFGTITTAWNELVLSLPAQGVAENNRLGRKYIIKALEIKGVLCQGSGSNITPDDTYNVVRIVIGLYNQSSTTPLSGLASLVTPITKTHFTQGRLIRKYYDKYITLVVTSVNTANNNYVPQLKNFKYYKRFRKPLIINFGDDTTNFPDKYLVMSAISDSAAPTNPGFIAGYIKCTYEDA